MPNATFTIVYPKYLSMYALAKYNFNPVAARNALINTYDTLQTDLQTTVDMEQASRAKFSGDPQTESCNQINTTTMAFYGNLLTLYRSAQDLSGAVYTAGSFHNENLDLQNAAVSACSNQGATPSAACVKLATMDEKLFPLLPAFDAMNVELLRDGQGIQDTIDTLLQAYLGMGCRGMRPDTSGGGNTLSIDTVFSSSYLDSLPIVDTDYLNTKLQELSPYYVSPNIINYISGKIIGTSEFNDGITNSIDYIKDMSKVTNSIVSLNTDIKPIQAGQFYNESGSSTGGFTNCPGGYYCPVTSTKPIQCPVNAYCPPGTTDQPIQCPPGLYSSPGANDISKCTSAWPLGYYQDLTTGKSVQCPTGYYCANGVRTACAAGTYNMKKGMSDAKSCLFCPKGSYCKTTTSITPCDAGTYNSSTQQTSSFACIACPAGTSCINKGTVTPVPCLPGTFSAATKLTKACTSVQGGYYLPGSGNTTDTGKQPCAAGYYCPGGTGNPVTCPAGSYCDVAQLTAAKPCAGGRYGATSGLTASSCSGPCDAGYICPPGSSVSYAIPCPEGNYCPSGSTNTMICPAGYYCPYESGTPTPCPQGTYNDSTSKRTVQDCKPCPAGKRCGVATATQGDPCPAGYYCTGGMDVNPCIPGGYCDETSLQGPKLCPAGTYNPNNTSSVITDCVPCAAGTWSNSPGEAGSCSQTCPPGSYCPSSTSIVSYTIPAAATASYNNAVNGRISLPIGTTQPIPCAAGAYCANAGMSSPTPCPRATYSSLTGQSLAEVCQSCANIGLVSTVAYFTSPYGVVAADSMGNIYGIVSAAKASIFKITSAGVITTLAGSVAGFADGTGLAGKV